MPSSRIFTHLIEILTRPKSTGMAFLVSVFVMMLSCESTETPEEKKNLVTKEHAALIGTWQEQDSLENVQWIFDQYEVKWKGFRHFYRVSGDSLIISGLVYQILEQSEKSMKLMKLDGKPCTLVRKD